MPNTTIKYFTVKEANKTLPLVKKIVRDILDTGYQIRTIAESLGGKIEGNPEIERLNYDLQEYMAELEEIGCYYKDWNFTIGLVDFPGFIDGEEIMLCWKSDEPEIMYYHGVDAGFAGRKPIPPELLEDDKK